MSTEFNAAHHVAVCNLRSLRDLRKWTVAKQVADEDLEVALDWTEELARRSK